MRIRSSASSSRFDDIQFDFRNAIAENLREKLKFSCNGYLNSRILTMIVEGLIR